MNEFEKVVRDDPELVELRKDVMAVRAKRHELAHSVGTVISDGRGGKVFVYFRDFSAARISPSVPAWTRSARSSP